MPDKKLFLLLIIGIAVLGSCSHMMLLPEASVIPENPETLNDIAYDVNKDFGYTIYLPEGEDYVPYLVLTNDYNGNCLLLREHLLDERLVYNYPTPPFYSPEDYIPPPSYYENSEIDKFLCGDFLDNLSSLQDKIVVSGVIITHHDSIGITGQETLTIKRKVFLLSHTEVTGRVRNHPAVEGVGLLCFNQDNKDMLRFRVGTTASGESFAWWLRTPDTWYGNLVFGVYDGYITGLPVTGGPYENISGVRPAFCLARDTPIYEDDLDGERVYKLEMSSNN